MTRGDRLMNVLHKTIQWAMMRGKTRGSQVAEQRLLETTETKTERDILTVKQTACFRLILRGETTSEATDACLSWGTRHFLYTCRGVQNSRSFCKVPGTSTDVLANRIIERRKLK